MLYILLTGILAISGMVMALLAIAFEWPVSEPYRIRPQKVRRLDRIKLYSLILANSALSIAMLYGTAWVAYEAFFYETAAPIWIIALEVVGILLLYDFLYYLLHRFLLHGPIKPLYKVHVLHHTASNPRAQDSLYVHPFETMLGLALLLLSTWIVGPIHVWSFVVLFGVYSLMNIIIHGGLRLPFFPFRFLGYMAKKHDTHHKSMKSGNYASITPVFDLLFRTAE